MRRHAPIMFALSIALSVLLLVQSLPTAALGEFGRTLALTAQEVGEAVMQDLSADDPDQSEGTADKSQPADKDNTATAEGEDQRSMPVDETPSETAAEEPPVEQKADESAALASAEQATDKAVQDPSPMLAAQSVDEGNGDAAPAAATSETTDTDKQEAQELMLMPQASYDLADFLTEDAIEYSNDNGATWRPLSGGTPAFGDQVRVRMAWTFPNEMTINAGDVFTCSLPNDSSGVINYLTATGNVMNGAQVDGTYSIDGSILTIRYTSDEGSNVTGSISFGGVLEGSTTDRTEGKTTVIEFPGTATPVEVHIDPTKSSLSTAKWSTQDSADKSLWHFVIRVNSVGPNDNVVISDVMGGLMTLANGNVRVTSDQDGNNPITANVTGASAGAGNFTVSIASMGDGQECFIHYDVKADPEVVSLANAAGDTSRATNTVTTKSDQSTPDPIQTTIWPQKTWSVTKSGEADTTAKTITWTIIINAGENGDPSGAKIKDLLGEDLSALGTVEVTESTDGSTWRTSPVSFSWEQIAAGTATLPLGSKGKQFKLVYTTAYQNEGTYGKTYQNTTTVTPNTDPEYPQETTSQTTVGNDDSKGEVEKRVLSDGVTATPEWLTIVTANEDLENIKVWDQTDSNQTINFDSFKVYTNEACTEEWSEGATVERFNDTYARVVINGKLPAGSKLYVKYTTTMTGSATQGDASGGYKVEVSNEAKLTYTGIISDKTSKAVYSQKTHLTKEPFSGRGGSDGGKFSWLLKVSGITGDPRSVTVIDTLPQNQSFVTGSVETVDDPWYVSEEYSGVSVVDNGNGTVTFTIAGEALAAAREGDVYVVYSTQWKDISKATGGEYVNKAQMIIDDVKEPEVSAKVWTSPPKVIDKTHAYTAATAPLVNYTIKVNPSAIKLNGGNTVTLTDQIPSAVELLIDTVKANGTPISRLPDYGYSYDKNLRVLTITMPDSTAATITYNGYVTLKVGDQLDASNAANRVALVTNYTETAESSSTINVRVVNPTAVTSSEYQRLMIYKHALSSLTTGLYNATFRVEALTVNRSGNAWTTATAESKGSLTSGTNGYTPVMEGLLFDTVYRIVEVNPPTGYQAADPLYVVFPGTDGTNYDAVTVDGQTITQLKDVQTGIVYIPNAPASQHVSVSLSGTKTITGRPFCVNDSFTFEVSPQDGAPAPKDATGNTVSTVTVKPGSGTTTDVDFGTINFSTEDMGGLETKTFTYAITERAGTSGGMTYDTDTRYVLVTVTRAAGGSLSAQKSYRKGTSVVDGLSFTNKYASTGINVSAIVNKALVGRDLVAGEFGFYLVPRGKDTPVVGFGTNDADGNVVLTHPSLGGVGRTYTLDALEDVECNADGSRYKTFSYTVYEITSPLTADQVACLAPDQLAAYQALTILPKGVTNTVSSRDFSVTIKDDGQGTMTATCSCGAVLTPVGGTPTTTGTPLTLRNDYRPVSTTISLNGTKSVQASGDAVAPSLESLAGKFTFVISGENDSTPLPANVTATNAADGTISFGDITFSSNDLPAWTAGQTSRSKDFTYKIDETGTVPGYASDGQKTVTVRVTDDGSGQLTAAVVSPTSAPSFTFTNTYSVTPTQASLEATKVQETADGLPAVTLGHHYYTFTLTGLDGAPMPEGATGQTITVPNEDIAEVSAKVPFGSISYQASDLAGVPWGTDGKRTKVFEYTIAEVIPTPGQPGITYDTTTHTASVTVTDDGSGELLSSVVYDRGTANESTTPPVITNLYEPSDATITLSGTKEILGIGSAGATHEPTIEELINKGYWFSIEAETEGAPLPANTTGTLATGADAQHGTITFDQITFKPADMGLSKVEGDDAVEDFVYRIVEHEPDDPDNIIEGLKIAAPLPITVRVTDHLAEGALKAEVLNSSSTSHFTVGNIYSGTSVPILGTKSMSGRPFRNGDEFTFNISKVTPEAPTLLSAQGEEVSSVTIRPVRGTVASLDFGAAVFMGDALPAGVSSKDFIYAISEQDDHAAGIKYDSRTFYAKVTVTRGASAYDSSVSYFTDEDCTQAASDGIAFANTYEADSVTATVKATKAISAAAGLNPPALTEGAYAFDLKDKDTDAVVKTAYNAADGSVTFDPIEYTSPGTYTYKIVEKPGNNDFITYDANVHDVTITVTDAGTGALAASVRYDGRSTTPPTITNTYSITTPAKATLQAKKVLEKRALRAGEFTFNLRTPSEGIIQTKTNAADGSVTFDSIEFTSPGTYTFLISEEQATEGHITFDSNVHRAEVTVTDNGTGALTASVVYDATSATAIPVFTNTYVPEDTYVQLEGVKSYNGMNKAGFRFHAQGPTIQEGTPIEEAIVAEGTTDANGNLVLSPITYKLDDLIALKEKGYLHYIAPASDEDAGTYEITYIVLEDGVDYNLPSRGIHPVRDAQLVTVRITDDGAALKATVDYGDYGRLSFVNVYAPSSPTISFVGAKSVVSSTSTDVPSVADIAGCFTFTISSSDLDAPMPTSDDTVITTVSNDINGQVAFYPIAFNIGLLDGADWSDAGTRSRTFEYTIKEGVADNLTEEQEELCKRMTLDSDKTVRVRLDDDGAGNLTVSLLDADGNPISVGESQVIDPDFSFVNVFGPPIPETPDGPPDTPSTPSTPSTPTTPTTPGVDTPTTPEDSTPPDSPTTDTPAPSSEKSSTGGSGYAAAKQLESKLPKTGDEAGRMLSMIAGIAVLAGLAILVVAVLTRRRKTNR